MKNFILFTLLLFGCWQLSAQDYYKLANDCFEKGDYECAKKNYNLFQTFEGRDMSAQIQKTDNCFRALVAADEYFKEKEYKKACDRYKDVLNINPKDPYARKQYDLLNSMPQPPTTTSVPPSTGNNNSQRGNSTPRQSGKTYIGIGSFTGYKCDQAETSATAAFTNDGRFIVSKVQNNRYGNNQQTSDDVDYIISAKSECIQRESTGYTHVPATKYSAAMNIPYKNPEIVNVVITLTNAQTGQIVLNSTYNLNQIYRISGDIFPVKFSIRDVKGNQIGIANITGGTYFVGDVFNVYEEYSNGSKNYLGKLKIGKTNEDCKISDGKQEINSRFKAGAKLVVTK